MLQRTLATLAAALVPFLTASVAMAQEAADVAHNPNAGYMAMAVAIGIGLAALGGALGQSRALSAALEGMARNPNAADAVFQPMMLGLAFIESLVLFAWVLMYQVQGKI